MAKDSSFDVVSQVDMQEMDNAVNQVKKEISQRYDFRGSSAYIELGEKEVKVAAEDEYKLGAILDMLRQKMAKRGIPLRCLVPGKIEPAAKGTVRQQLDIQQGISKENGKKIQAAIKATKLKVTAQLQDDQVRVSGAKKDDLQAVIQMLKAGDFGVDLQFINMRQKNPALFSKKCLPSSLKSAIILLVLVNITFSGMV